LSHPSKRGRRRTLETSKRPSCRKVSIPSKSRRHRAK
jgi:hypothetical protein